MGDKGCMTDKELCQRMIGLESPWKVVEVKLDMEARKVDVRIDCGRAVAWADAQGRRLHVHGWEKRSWRHLDTMGFETRLHAEVPRVKGPDGKTETVQVPWAGQEFFRS
jgi:transposase